MISIITIVYNGVNHIEETVLSVINQKDISIEYIVIDGGSSDGTMGIINKYKKHIKHFVSEPDNGIYDAINKGLALATMPIVGLIHCGDYYKENALKVVYDSFCETDADVLYGNIEIIEQVDQEIISSSHVANHHWLKNRMSIFHPSSFVKLDIYKKFGTYNTSFKSAADYEFFLKVYLNRGVFVHIPKVLSVFRAGGTSGTNLKLSLKEVYKIKKTHLGASNAINYVLSSAFISGLLVIRKKMIVLLLGKKQFNKLKLFKFKNLKSK